MLYLHHSNRLETLLDSLLDNWNLYPLPILRQRQILVQNPGMKRWLQLHISRRHSVSANIAFPLPSRFIWDIFIHRFQHIDQLSTYDAEVLRWIVMDVIKQHADDKELNRIKVYLTQDESGLALFQLAQKLAGLFDQYLVYRPQMIAAWERGQSYCQTVEESWQMHLWQLCRQMQPQPHRAELIKRLVKDIRQQGAQGDHANDPIFVFAISAMSPLYTDVLAELSRDIDVHYFILNPCEHYWGDLQDRREMLRQKLQGEPENALLASLGKQGRDFIDQFYSRDYPSEDNQRFHEPAGSSLLASLQRQILTLQPEMDTEADDSIQISSCYSEMRELQLLHDELLKQFELDPSLQVDDVLVMCPDIDTLAPQIDAVFGQQPDSLHIPYNISDQSDLSSSPILNTLLDWLALPSQRFTANQVLGWLETPALQRAYGLDDEMLEVIRQWVRSNHIRWGLDADHKASLGLGENAINSWSHGLSRLLAAYVTGSDNAMFYQHVSAAELINQQEYHALGQLQRLLDDLKTWSRRLAREQTLEQWQQSINSLIDQLMVVDNDEEWQLKPLRDEMSQWMQQTKQAGFEHPVSADVVRDLLQNAFSERMTHHQYLSGAVNFCNLIPMRSLPFRVICLIGFGDDRFPRNQLAPQFDLIASFPQKGDRSRREDDRYMFLQTILSARDKLYISYVGNNRQDDSEIQPSVVVKELIDHVAQSSGIEIPIQKTSLQAFSPMNFEQGSFARQWQVGENLSPPLHFNQALPKVDKPDEIGVADLLAFYRNPLEFYLKRRLNLSLDEYDDSLEDEEVFGLDPLTGYLLNKRLLDDLLETDPVDERKYLNSGALSHDNLGRLQLVAQVNTMQDLAQQVKTHPLYEGEQRLDIGVDINGQRISGLLHGYSTTTLLQVFPSKLSGRNLFNAWIQANLFSLARGSAQAEVFFRDKQCRFQPLDKRIAEANLAELMGVFNNGLNTPVPFYADVAYQYRKVKKDKDEAEARLTAVNLWNSDSTFSRSERENIYVQTLNGDNNELDESFFILAAQLFDPLLSALEDGS